MIASITPELRAARTRSCTVSGHDETVDAARFQCMTKLCVLHGFSAMLSGDVAPKTCMVGTPMLHPFLCKVDAPMLHRLGARTLHRFGASKKTLQVNPLPPCTCVQGGTSSAGDFNWVVTKPKQSCTQPQTVRAGTEVSR